MGCSMRVMAVVGVDYDLVVVKSRTEEILTKYHPDSGRPYELKVPKTVLTFAGQPISEAEDVVKLLPKGLELIYGDGCQYIGAQIANQDIEYKSSCDQFTLDQLANIAETVRAGLASMGVEAAPKVMFISYMSA